MQTVFLNLQTNLMLRQRDLLLRLLCYKILSCTTTHVMPRYQDLLLHLVRCKRRRGPKTALWVHTGGIDCTWKKIKDKIPSGIHTNVRKTIITPHYEKTIINMFFLGVGRTIKSHFKLNSIPFKIN